MNLFNAILNCLIPNGLIQVYYKQNGNKKRKKNKLVE